MGSDFFIHVYLEIEHKKGVCYYELPAPRGYFCDELSCNIYDSDQEEEDRYSYNEKLYQELYAKMVEYFLTPRPDIVIYENEKFTKQRFETKYLPILQKKINSKKKKYCIKEDTGSPLTNINDIIKVTKKEIRYEPEY